MRAVIALILLLGSLVMILGFAIGSMVVPENDIGKAAIASWLTMTTVANAYYFGSNSQSKTKDDTAKAQADTIATMVQPANVTK